MAVFLYEKSLKICKSTVHVAPFAKEGAVNGTVSATLLIALPNVPTLLPPLEHEPAKANSAVVVAGSDVNGWPVILSVTYSVTELPYLTMEGSAFMA